MSLDRGNKVINSLVKPFHITHSWDEGRKNNETCVWKIVRDAGLELNLAYMARCLPTKLSQYQNVLVKISVKALYIYVCAYWFLFFFIRFAQYTNYIFLYSLFLYNFIFDTRTYIKHAFSVGVGVRLHLSTCQYSVKRFLIILPKFMQDQSGGTFYLNSAIHGIVYVNEMRRVLLKIQVTDCQKWRIRKTRGSRLRSARNWPKRFMLLFFFSHFILPYLGR